MSKIAIIITCHNRQSKTLECLKSLLSQKLSKLVVMFPYVLDDGSTDQTSTLIQQYFPSVQLLKGDGTLFWNRGMYRAWQKALESNYDYYLWLNDDTVLVPQALSCLLATQQQLAQSGQADAIIVGSTQDPQTKALTYGGIIRSKFWHPLKFSTITPQDQPIECETMNGNCVLIPRAVAQKVGNLDPIFHHSLGDFDYGLRAREQGYSVWIAPGYLGTCSVNGNQGTWQDQDMPFKERLHKVVQPKGLPSQEWKLFASRHGGPFWYVYWISPYIRLFLTSLFLHRHST
jgi:GT2 family glycosyltransferase